MAAIITKITTLAFGMMMPTMFGLLVWTNTEDFTKDLLTSKNMIHALRVIRVIRVTIIQAG